MPKWLPGKITKDGTGKGSQISAQTVQRVGAVTSKPETSVQTQAPATRETNSTGSSETTSKPETSVQVQGAAVSTAAVTNTSATAGARTVDAGISITFSVPIRGGLFNDGSANPPL